MKKIIGLIVLIILPTYSMAFVDTEEHWAKEYINSLAESNVLSGYPDNTFKPDNKVTRAEFITMLVKTLKFRVEESGEFWADGFVKVAKSQGIINDADNLTDNILRKEVIEMLIRSGANSRTAYTGIQQGDSKFVDIFDEESKIKNCVTILYESGIISGYEDNTIRLQNELTRAEASAIICKFIENKDKLDNYKLGILRNYYDESVFINYKDLPYELSKWKNGNASENLVTTIINSLEIFEFSEEYHGKYKEVFNEIYHSDNPYFEYRKKFGDKNYVVVIDFDTKNNSEYETVTGYNYLNIEFPEENIKIIDSFDIDEIAQQREKRAYNGVKVKPNETQRIIAFYVVDNFPQEIIKLSRYITTMYDQQNQEIIDVESYNSLVIGNLK